MHPCGYYKNSELFETMKECTTGFDRQAKRAFVAGSTVCAFRSFEFSVEGGAEGSTSSRQLRLAMASPQFESTVQLLKILSEIQLPS